MGRRKMNSTGICDCGKDKLCASVMCPDCTREFIKDAYKTVDPTKKHVRPGYETVDIPKSTLGHDPVNHPKHYTAHPSGIECIDVTRHMGFNIGNAIKYLWRFDLKNGIEDLKKAAWYIQDEIKKREKGNK